MFIKFSIINILILLLWNFKIQLILQFPCPLMIKVIMEILFAVLMTSVFLPKYECCIWIKVFYSRSALKTMGMWLASLNCCFIVDLEQAFVNNNFNSIVISLLIILFVISAPQAFIQNNFFISSIKELFYCYLDAIR